MQVHVHLLPSKSLAETGALRGHDYVNAVAKPETKRDRVGVLRRRDSLRCRYSPQRVHSRLSVPFWDSDWDLVLLLITFAFLAIQILFPRFPVRESSFPGFSSASPFLSSPCHSISTSRPSYAVIHATPPAPSVTFADCRQPVGCRCEKAGGSPCMTGPSRRRPLRLSFAQGKLRGLDLGSARRTQRIYTSNSLREA
jgi:hypothetical protein